MKRTILMRITACLAAMLVSGMPASLEAEDVLVHAIGPGYEILVGRDLTFEWYETASVRNQHEFELRAGTDIGGAFGTVADTTSRESYTWPNFPFGSAWWEVEVWARVSRIGRTSKQNFYHYNNVPGLQNVHPNPFEYKEGARETFGSADTNVFYEVMQDYSVDLVTYFTDPSRTPPNHLLGKWDNTDAQHRKLREHIAELPDVDWEFIKLEDGILTIRKGYRWDGASTPWNNLNVADNREFYVRGSCVHDSIYDLMRMEYLAHDETGLDFGDPGFLNRLMADIMIYILIREDGRGPGAAESDFEIIRGGGIGKTHKDKLLYPWKYHVSDLTAWASDGVVRLHWKPANLHGRDPWNYSSESHRYEVYRTTAGSHTWTHIDTRVFTPAEIAGHDESTVYFVDGDVINGVIYYYWIRVNDPDTDGDGWTDQEEDDYGLFDNSYKWPNSHPLFGERHYDESTVAATVPVQGAGNALLLDGVDDFIAADSVSSALGGPSITFEAWVYPTPQSGNNAVLAFNSSSGGNHNLLTYDGANQRFCYYDGGNGFLCSAPHQALPSRWYHVAVTIDDVDHGTLWIDGAQALNFTTPVRPSVNGRFSIGQEWDGNTRSQEFKGRIDEVRVWNRARPAHELRSSMCEVVAGNQDGLAGVWHLDEPQTIRSAYDATVGSHAGILAGYPIASMTSFVTSGAMEKSADAQARDLTLDLDDTGRAVIGADQIYSGTPGLCNIRGMSVEPNSFGCDDVGANTVVLSLTDQTGRVTTSVATVMVNENAVCTVVVPGDFDGDGDIDRNDLGILMADRNRTVGVSSCGAPCDLDGDGVITVLDARKLILQCTRPRCAP